MNDSQSSTPTTAVNGVQADSQQSLTAPVATALYQTPTMSFGEVGKVAEQSTSGYSAEAHSVGEFGQTELLERMVLIDAISWGVGAGISPIYQQDIDAKLRAYPRNKNILDLFRFYRTDIEVTVKLNTNQFYYGALMATMFPGDATGDFPAERCVLDPTVISAASAESVLKTWTWTWPVPWRGLNDSDATKHPVWLFLDALVDLKAALPDLPGSITVQIWGRFKNIRLAYPSQNTDLTEELLEKLVKEGKTETQSGKPRVAQPKGHYVQHPAQDRAAGGNPITDLVDAVTQIPMTAIDGLVGTVSGVLDTGVGTLLGSLFDKPDQVDEQTPMIIEGSKDLFAADIPDTNVCLSLHKSKYVDPGPTRMPLTKDWTLRDYAAIPGIRTVKQFTNAGGGASTLDFSVVLATTAGDAFRTPLDYATKCAAFSRGSVKIMLQFVTSAFISARFVVQLWRTDGTHGPDAEYDYGISRVVNVKGDTVDTFTVPWLDPTWWVENDPRQIRIKIDSDIASTNVMATSEVWLVVWIAGGEDYQFQFPRCPLEVEWPNNDDTETQCSIGKVFSDKFVPIVENVFYDEDHGFATNESVELMTDVAKRYSPLNVGGVSNPSFDPLTFNSDVLDATPLSAATTYPQYIANRKTLFGAMRACFMFRSGGYRYRVYHLQSGNIVWTAYIPLASSRTLLGTVYPHPFDSVSRLTVPQVSSRPFVMTNDNTSTQMPPYSLGLKGNVLSAPLHLAMLAARDDVQFGYPILPKGVPQVPLKRERETPKPDLRRASSGIRQKQPSKN